MNKLNDTEIKAKTLLEQNGWQVLKPSYPDFIIFKEDKKTFAFVEVKRNWNDPERPNQAECRRLLEDLGLPCTILRSDDDEDSLKKQIHNLKTTQNLKLIEVLRIKSSIVELQGSLDFLYNELLKIETRGY